MKTKEYALYKEMHLYQERISFFDEKKEAEAWLQDNYGDNWTEDPYEWGVYYAGGNILVDEYGEPQGQDTYYFSVYDEKWDKYVTRDNNPKF